MVSIIIEDNPVSWRSHAGFGRRSYNPRYQEIKRFKQSISTQYTAEPLSGKIKSHCSFYFAMPNSWSKKKRAIILSGDRYHDTRPDATNCWKLFEDCLKGIVFPDDCKVVRFTAEKFWDEYSRIICHIESF
jgi:Holliday junction resolvase RusA-like endonuclease